jgi:acetyl esterase/lipase
VDRDVASAIAAIGDVVSPETLDASRAVYADAHEEPPYGSVVLTRDVAYGPHERHRLDLFAAPGSRDLPVILFVHGGGFVRGDKSTPGTPHNENVGLWACRSGMVGVTMNYRLAPEHRWPAGAQDVAAAVAWLRANVAARGGDPDRIVLVGSSAGATHIASYAALPELHPDGEPGAARPMRRSASAPGAFSRRAGARRARAWPSRRPRACPRGRRAARAPRQRPLRVPARARRPRARAAAPPAGRAVRRRSLIARNVPCFEATPTAPSGV